MRIEIVSFVTIVVFTILTIGVITMICTVITMVMTLNDLLLHLILHQYRPGGLGHVDTDFTGSGVRAAVQIIRQIICEPDI